MKKLIFAALVLFAPTANAYIIETSAQCPGDPSCDTSFQDNYGYNTKIESVDGITWNFNLTNAGSNGVIDSFAMNMVSALGADFTVTNFDPNTWTFSAATGGVQFDYVGDANSPTDRLNVNETLTFDFVFNTVVDETEWSNAAITSGAGIGDGETLGQFGVSFQSLAFEGNYSDFLTSNWEYLPNTPDEPGTVSEPTGLALLGLGLMGMVAVRKRK